MSNALTIIRSLVIYSLCLPLAIFLGYLLAMPMDAMSLTIVVSALLLPVLPLMLKHHHLLVFACWNTSMVLFFLPGRPSVFMVMTAISFGLAIVQHILNRNIRFLNVPSVTRPLIFLVIVIFVTAWMTGGLGTRLLGGEAYGGKRYFILLCAITGYFALTCYRVPAGKANLYVALYLFGTLTAIVGNLAPFAPRNIHFIFALFPVESLSLLQEGGVGGEVAIRMSGLTFATTAMVCYILARHGVRGLFDFQDRWSLLPVRFEGGFGFNNPWRLLIFLTMVWISLLGGYRSVVVIYALTLIIQFYLEGLFRSHLLPAFALGGILLAAVSLPMMDKMPIMVQRSLSFLPANIDPVARYTAESTVEWRLQMWRSVLPLVPQYLFLGKGYAIDPSDLAIATANEQRTGVNTAETSILSSDYHNGPLSVIIPLGIFGVIAFLWFLFAGYRVLLNNFRYGDPELRQINTFLLAYFIAKVVFFLGIFGTFYGELMVFTGLVGMSVSINGGMRKPEPVPVEKPAFAQFKLARAVR